MDNLLRDKIIEFNDFRDSSDPILDGDETIEQIDQITRDIIKKRDDAFRVLATRFDDLFPDTIPVMRVCGFKEKSLYKFKRELSSLANLEIVVENFEAALSPIRSARLQKEALAATISIGAQVKSLTDNIMNLIIGYNMNIEKSAEQIATDKANFQDIFLLLQSYQPFTAKKLIVTADIDAALKESILSLYPEPVV